MGTIDSLTDYVQTVELDYYHCTFFFPLIPALGKEKPPAPALANEFFLNHGNTDETDQEAYHYFTPILRNLIFNQGTASDQNLTPLREWRLPKTRIETWSLTLKKLPPKPNKYLVPDKTVYFESVRFYQYFNGLQLLAFTVKPAPNQSMIMEDWLHFTRLARQLYPSFTEQIKERKLAPLIFNSPQGQIEDDFSQGALSIPPTQALGLYFSPIVKHLIQQFFANDSQIQTWLEQSIALYDDRMFVSVAYSLPTEVIQCTGSNELTQQQCQTRLKQIKALVAYTDRGAEAGVNGYYYDSGYIENDLKDKTLTLWEQTGSTYFYTDIINAYLSHGDFFKTKIAAKDIPNKYDRMLIQALFYQASLRHYDQRITTSTSQLLTNDTETAIQEQYAEFIRFTNQYWFADLTQQMQGKAIGRLQQQGLELKTQYAQILEELNRTSDFIQTKQELAVAKLSLQTAQSSETLAKASQQLTAFGAAFAALAIYYAIIAILIDWREAIGLSTESSWQWSYWQQKLPSSMHIQDWGLGLILLILPLGIAFIVYKILHRKL